MSRPDMQRRLPRRGDERYEFNPRDIANMFLWLRADRNITLAGADVSAWGDSSGFNNNFSQGTVLNRPTYIATDPNFNSQPTLNFTGTKLIASTGAITNTFADVTFCIVYRPTAVAVGTLLESSPNVALNPGSLSLSENPTNNMDITMSGAAGVDQQNQTTPDAINTKQRKIAYFPFSSGATANPAIYTNGISSATITVLNTATNTNSSSQIWNLGARAGVLMGFQGQIAEIIAYGTSLTSGQISNIDSYFLSRYY